MVSVGGVRVSVRVRGDPVFGGMEGEADGGDTSVTGGVGDTVLPLPFCCRANRTKTGEKNR